MSAIDGPGDQGAGQLALDGLSGRASAPASSVAVPGPGPVVGQGMGVLLAQLGARSSKLFAERVAALGLSAADAAVLRLVAYAPGLSQREIADRLGLQPSRLVSLVDSLEARGLVERSRSTADRRLYELRLAGGGMAVYGELARAIADHDEAMCGRLDAGERSALAALLQRLAADAGLASGPELRYRLP